MVTALLHDIGKLVLVHAYPGYPRQVHGDARTPEERLQRERRELGVDHALVGGVIARRWGLPASIAQVIESHHSDDTEGEAAIVRLADMLAHYLLGGAVTPVGDAERRADRSISSPRSCARSCTTCRCRRAATGPRQVDPCPMSAREVDVLKRLAKGMVYKQIASELGLSTSTVRTHLHNVYGKLGAMDRAQAVLIATERGWICHAVRASYYDVTMLSITSKSPYAVRALVELHRFGDADPVPIGELARRGEIPAQFLEQLFARSAGPACCAHSAASRAATASPSPPRRSPCSRWWSCSTARSAQDATGVFAAGRAGGPRRSWPSRRSPTSRRPRRTRRRRLDVLHLTRWSRCHAR